ncbi:hypothetical protein EOK75_02300 [Pseudorhodobacter turbinis]|uniref:Dihydrodipicolinate reductase n=1 Tax=Pseudorhodobacter turbinis TaxID=2500533 RepID=A0A4V1E0I2_9RHOB|nr:hypothetical protein [Pseudorhodobacter turbinis]QCO54724.1 hypothetical protein EOK75_02300 [Pseudorhodobacter turbinis]
MKKLFLVACISASIASFGTAQADETETIKQAISGKTIVSGTAEIKLSKNGRMTGKAGSTTYKGAWTVRDGKFCRTITEPKKWAGTECQPTKLGGGIISLTGRNGPADWAIK